VFYIAPDDVWEIVRTLVEQRLLRGALLDTPQGPEERHAQSRMREMHDLIDMLTGWYQDMQKMETARLVQLLKLGSKNLQIIRAEGQAKAPRRQATGRR
jgi:DNA-binding transcriptional regulator GbsR (MarR family)